ncbi:MAG: non-homologous end-joining DNA ligase [Egibacteraceae bacterium]
MTVKLTHPDKVLWPDVTKGELAAYLEAVAERMLPHLAGRPISLLRHPNGIGEAGFLQKNLPRTAPAFLSRCTVWTPSSQREVSYPLADGVNDLRWMANQNSVELHHWLARCDRPDRADWLVWDLDPEEGSVPAATAASWLKAVLDELELSSAVKTSGKRGLHVCVPVERRYDYEELRGFGLAVARACQARHPDQLTVQMRKAERRGRLLLDWSRNGAAQTIVAAWSPRAHPAATVSMPLHWDEVGPDLDPAEFTIATSPERDNCWAQLPAARRIERQRDLLAEQGFPSVDQSPRAHTRE